MCRRITIQVFYARMGTKVHSKSYLPGHYSMRDLNEDSSSSGWPLFYGDKTITNGQYFNGFMPVTDQCPGNDKDALKQKMLEHEAIFKNQVYELHRLYRIQRDMMEEIKITELQKHQSSLEPSSSSNLQGSQMLLKDAQKWHMTGMPLLNSSYGRASMLGFEIANSPLSCTKGNDTQPGPSQFLNGCTSKDIDTLDSRPSKVRKKFFDLQLPADEYIHGEEGEQVQDHKVSGMLSSVSNGDKRSALESTMKFFLGAVAGGKTDCHRDISASGSCWRSSGRLADLNEPIPTDEGKAPSSVDFLCNTSNRGEVKAKNQSVKQNARFFGVPGETIRSCCGSLMNSYAESKDKERGLLSHAYEAGSSKSHPTSAAQGLQQNKFPMPCQSAQVMLNQVYHAPEIYPSGHSRDLWRSGADCGLQPSDRRDYSNNSHLEPLVVSHIPAPCASINSSGFANAWSPFISSWTKSANNSTQKLTTVQPSFHPAAANRCSEQYAQSQETFGDKWQVNSSSRLNPVFQSELTRNGFYNGSASGSKELLVHLTSAGFDNLNCSSGNNVASDQSTSPAFKKFLNGSSHMDLKPTIDINLNEVLPKSLSSEEVTLQDLTMMNGKCKPDDNAPELPWLKPKVARQNAIANTRRSELSEDMGCLQSSSCVLHGKCEEVRDLNQIFVPNAASSDLEMRAKREMSGAQNIKKILGVPIFEPCACNNESSALVSSPVCPPDVKIFKAERKNWTIDINLDCDSDEQIIAEELVLEKEMCTLGKGIRHGIDLNSCISEDQDTPATSLARNNVCVKINVEIDLEAPVILGNENDSTPSKENKQDETSIKIQDAVSRNAAETLISISSFCHKIHVEDDICHPPEVSSAETLLWFANVVTSGADEIENKSCKGLRIREGASFQDLYEDIDDFEAMTLQLTETKEEDYMPKPFIPEVQNMEETGASSNRTRRGQARRGRQLRDFQRDILPGLASLSRHEVTEDLQTFGGLMRAAGHIWNTGLTRRNGSRNGGVRGRRRTVVESSPSAVLTPISIPLMLQLNNIEAGLEDGSLTGWGKTTRRPRRQRCPAGNPPTVALA